MSWSFRSRTALRGSRSARWLSARRQRYIRSLQFEMFEERCLLAVDWRNPADALDVNHDRAIAPIDALLVVTELNEVGSHALADDKPATALFLDPSGDQLVTPRDALLVINALNEDISGPRVLRESPRLVTEQPVTITVGQDFGSRIYRAKITTNFDTTDQQTALEDLLAVSLVNVQFPEETLLDRGEEGTTLFTLAGQRAEYAPGIVRWDGSILEIDLTGAQRGFDTGLLRFQLFNSDSDLGSSVTIAPLDNIINDTPASDLRFPATAADARAPIGGPLNLAALSTVSDIELLVENVRLNPVTLRYQAEMRLRNNGAAVGRDVAAIFRGLFSLPGVLIVDVEGASGLNANREPYINFRAAIPPGGLGHGQTSAPITVTFFDPQSVAFFLRPEIKAGANHAPVLDPLGPWTITPGATLSLPLHATDADGDPVTYRLRSSGPLPTGELRADGRLVFQPTPADLGSYSFEIVASDGVAESSRAVTLQVVPDPLGTTRISGSVLQTTGQPLAGIVVEVGGVQGLTAADGSFQLDLGAGPVVGDTIKIHGELRTGAQQFPFIAERLALVLEHDVYPHYHNAITRPIYLPVLDSANARQINPLVDTLVTTAAIPGASVMVRAGTLMNQQGTPFTGQLSITEVPAQLTPAALPAGLRPGLVVTIQPGDMVFASPAPLTLPNRGNYPPGTLMDLWSINPDSGQFDKVGRGRVTADGSLIETISGGIRNSSWHDFLPLLQEMLEHDPNPRNEEPGCGGCRATAELTSEVDLHSGALLESHDLVSYQSNSTVHTLRLRYDSLRADPRPIVYFDIYSTYDLPANCSANGEPCFFVGTPIPEPDASTRLAASLTVQTGTFRVQADGYAGTLAGLSAGENFWTYTNRDHVQAALQVDLRNTPSGIFPYTVNSGFVRGDAAGFSGSLTTSGGQLVSVNTIDSPFGAGWGISGLQSLVVDEVNNTVLLIDGDGSETRFTGSGDGLYQSPIGDFTRLERVQGLFRRTTPDQTVYRFNSDLQLASITDRQGNTTTYEYQNKRLVSLTDPVGLSTTFTYTGGRVTRITDPAGRATNLTYDSAGNLTSITDPDQSRRTWDYDRSHHMISEVDPLSRREETYYGFHGRVIGGTRKDGSQIQVAPLQTQGLVDPVRTRDPLQSPPLIEVTTAQASYLDGTGKITATPLDRFGFAQANRDALGQLPAVTRDSRNLPTTILDGRGHATLQTFDAQGNLVSSRDELSGGGAVVGAITPVGEVDRYTFSGRAGQRVFIDGPRGDFNAWVAIFDSLGTYLGGQQTLRADASFFYQQIVLPQDGDYSVTVQHLPIPGTGLLPSPTGGYRFRLIDPAQAPDLPLTAPLLGSLSEDQFFQVQGRRGQTLHITDTLGFAGFNVRPVVYGPTGTQLTSAISQLFEWEFLFPTDGTYSIQLHTLYPGEVRRYEFDADLNDAAPIAKTGLDVDHRGLFGTPDAHVPFSAPAGTPLLFYWFDKDVHSASVYDPYPTGHYLLNNDLASFQFFSVTRSGNFVVDVRPHNYVDEPPDFAFRLVDLSAAPLVPLGSTVQGSLEEDGRVAVYRFQGTAGQQIDFGPASPGAGRFLHFGADSYFDASGVTTLTQTGEYQIILYKTFPFATPTNYQFSLQPVPTPIPLVRDELVTGTLLPGEGRRYFSIDLADNETLYFDDQGSSPAIQFRNPTFDMRGGEFDDGPLLSDVERRYQYLQAGRQLIVLDAADADRPASYRFQIRTPHTSTSPLTLGQTIETTFTDPLQTNAYTFAGMAGQTLYLDSLPDNLNEPFLTVRLFDALTGRVLVERASLDDVFQMITLPRTGDYRLELEHRADSPASARFRLLDLAAAPLVPLNVAQSATIDPLSESDLYRFHATAGQILRIELTAGQSRVFPQLFYPDGEPLPAMGNPLILPMSATGDYGLLWFGPNAGTDPYSFTISDVSSPAVTPAGIDHVYAGTGIGQEEIVGSFTGNAGTLIFLNGRQGNGDVNVYDEDNQRVLSSNLTVSSTGPLSRDSFFALPKSGNYTVKVNATADYAFRLRPAAEAPQIAFAATVNGTLPVDQASDLFRFSVAAGQTVILDSLVGGAELVYTIYTPHGTQSFGPDIFPPSNSPAVLSTPGTYFVTVTRTAGSGAYSFQLLDPAAAPLLPFDTLDSGTSTPSGRAILRRFAGVQGQKIHLTSSGGNWELFDEQHFNHNLTSQVDTAIGEKIFTLPATGTYFLRRNSDDANLPSNYFVQISLLPDPLVSIELSYLASGQVTYSYDPVFNQRTSRTDEQGRVTLWDIDPVQGNTRSVTRVVGAPGGPDDQVTSLTYLPGGLVDTRTDPLGRVTNYDYDSRRRLITVTSAQGTADEAVVHYEYDEAGNVTAYVDPNGRRTGFQYDAANRLVRITAPDPDGAGPLTSPVTQFTYDAAGNRLSTTDANGHTTSWTYDVLNRMSSQLDPEHHETRYSYDASGNLTRVVDPLNQTTEYRYDVRQRLTETIDPTGRSTQLAYDLSDNLTSLTDADGNQTLFVYDARNRLVRQTDPLGAVSVFTYSTTNDLLTGTDPLGRTTLYRYDELARLVQETWQRAGGSADNTVDYSYDLADNLRRVADTRSIVTMEYDALRRVTQVETSGTGGLPTATVDFAYDPAGNLLTVSDTINGQAGGINSYTYDALQRVTRIVQSGPGITTKRVDLQYNPLDQLTTLSRFLDAAGTTPVATSSYSYDTLNRLSSLTHRNSANSVLDSFAYQYDAASRITRITDSDGVTNYGYNKRSELTAANHADPANPDEVYVYDPAGNRTSSTLHGTAYVYGDGPGGNADDNRLASDGTYRYSYDAVGNLIRRERIADGAIREFTWDQRNRLVQVTDRPQTGAPPSQIVRYTYDALDRRLAQMVDPQPADGQEGATTYYVYAGVEVLVDLVDPDGAGAAPPTESQRYLHGPAVDQVLAQEDASGNVLWHLADHQGTIHDLVNAQGTVVNHLKYDSYGRLISQTQPSFDTRYRYTGREYDESTDLQYHRARYYDPSTGRFLSQDPTGFSGGINLYAYANGSPVLFTDPLGTTVRLSGGGSGNWLPNWWQPETRPLNPPPESSPGSSSPNGGGTGHPGDKRGGRIPNRGGQVPQGSCPPPGWEIPDLPEVDLDDIVVPELPELPAEFRKMWDSLNELANDEGFRTGVVIAGGVVVVGVGVAAGAAALGVGVAAAGVAVALS
ncbi:MAG: RHS repeat-associated core domain-containing protein [Pirellulales bacterium]